MKTADNQLGMETQQKKKTRDSSFELLRIISMFSIVACHFATHGKFNFNTQTLSIPRLWWYFIEMGGNFGVNIFVLISGYFLINSQDGLFNIKRIVKFWGQVFFYSILIYVILGMAGVSDFSLKSLTKAFFPILSNRWWFASTYFVLYLLHPFLNILLNKLSKILFQALLVLLIFIWCIIPTFTLTTFQSNDLLWFITLYSIAGYIRRFDLNPKYNTKHYIILVFIFSSLRYLSSVTLILLSTKISFVANYLLAFYGKQSVLTFLSALSLFMVFKNITLDYHNWINFIASATFGVYLIHDDHIVRQFLWQTVFKNSTYQNSTVLVPYSIGVICCVYTVCTIIELLRKTIIEKPFLSIVSRYEAVILRPFETLITFGKNIVFGNEIG